jgi:SAM-dependent methyltransferase
MEAATSMGVIETAKRGLRGAARLMRLVLPLAVRRLMVIAFGGRAWVPYRHAMAVELLRDFAETDPSAWHRFLWAHHLAYAESYEVDQRFGRERIVPSRIMLFDDLREFLVRRGIEPEGDIASVFEVGCSLGYLLRHLETGLFRSATTLEGIDIDRQAVEQGSAYLAGIGSKVRLAAADVSELSAVLSGRTADVVLCTGVVMYLPEDEARLAVSSILRHTNVVAAFSGLADPSVDNASLADSRVRQSDGTFIHNIDAMVVESGGLVAWRRWEGPRSVDGNTIYFVFASPLAST